LKRLKPFILFVLPNLQGGGAERVFLGLLKGLDRGAFDLGLAVFRREGPLEKELPADITLYDLRADRVLKGLPALTVLIRKMRPDAVFSTLVHLNLAVLLGKPWFRRETRVVVRETTMARHSLNRFRAPAFWSFLLTRLYPRSDRIVCSCWAMAEELGQLLPKGPEKICVIPNPVDEVEIQRKIEQEENPFLDQGPGPHVLAVSRLRPEKGMERLIRSFSLLAAHKKEAKLWILGDGEEEGVLRNLISELNLEGRVFLTGFRPNPFPWMAHADLFVLPSFFEGTPNALLEALACGAPVVVWEQEGGAKEILEKVGLLDRYVPSLDPWPDSWWERPPDRVIGKLEEHFGVRSVLARYQAMFYDLWENP
jgi:glycosyltransferase involved in cell wall biosynthesis